jgi:hypothetical protein
LRDAKLDAFFPIFPNVRYAMCSEEQRLGMAVSTVSYSGYPSQITVDALTSHLYHSPHLVEFATSNRSEDERRNPSGFNAAASEASDVSRIRPQYAGANN